MVQSAEITRPAFARRRNGEAADPETQRIALRTAFVARFIVLREGRRSRAHRIIEQLSWAESSTADDVYNMFKQAFIANGDKMQPVDRDLKRALAHAKRSVDYFVEQYLGRSSKSFKEALEDYERSNKLLFGEDAETPLRSGGWRLPSEQQIDKQS